MFIIIILQFCILSCDEINNNPTEEGKISIVSTLQTGGDKQYVKVYYLSNLSVSSKYDSLIVKDAEVKLTGDDFAEDLKFGVNRDYYGVIYEYFYETTNSIKNKLLPGKTYRLFVKSGTNLIEGTTTFPEEFHLTSHKNNDTITSFSSMIFRWTKSQNSYIYIFRTIRVNKIFYNGNYNYSFDYTDIITRDTSYEFPSFASPVSPPPYEATTQYYSIKVIAMDKNYYDHTYLMRERAGLDGGYGCFSSGVVDTVRLYFKE